MDLIITWFFVLWLKYYFFPLVINIMLVNDFISPIKKEKVGEYQHNYAEKSYKPKFRSTLI